MKLVEVVRARSAEAQRANINLRRIDAALEKETYLSILSAIMRQANKGLYSLSWSWSVPAPSKVEEWQYQHDMLERIAEEYRQEGFNVMVTPSKPEKNPIYMTRGHSIHINWRD